MLQIIPKNVFNTGAKCLVNPINTQGVMGAGLALDFKLKYPHMFDEYKQKCQQHQVHIGQPYLYQDSYIQILNFPTKTYWAQPSQIEWIEQGLNHFIQNYQIWNIKSIAFPMLGTGLGGLDSTKIEILMLDKFKNLDDITIFICKDSEEPQGTELEMLNYLFESQPKLKNTIKRFRDLQKIKSKFEYENLFLEMYSKTKEYSIRKDQSQPK
jgi:O-acetyl-ADP-ribose deacetylase (regulator of RNase III)